MSWLADVLIASVAAFAISCMVMDIRRIRQRNKRIEALIARLRSAQVYDNPPTLMDAIFDVLPDTDARGREASKLASPASRPLLYSVPMEAERVSLRIVQDAIAATLKDAS